MHTGHSIQEIKKSLKKAGHSQENIDLAIKQVKIRKTVMISGLVVLVLILIVATSFGVKELLKEPEYIPPEETKVESKIVILNDDELLYRRAIEENDRNLCFLIEDLVVKAECLEFFDNPPEPVILDESELEYEQAIEENDVSSCENIVDEIVRAECFEFFDEERNEEIAVHVQGDEELYRSAIEEWDITLCYEISDEIIEQECLEFFQ